MEQEVENETDDDDGRDRREPTPSADHFDGLLMFGFRA
jgi:hypothetical protein